jgi:hypothetical protein
MKLTDTFLRNIKTTDKVQKYADGGGLYLYVAPTGGKHHKTAKQLPILSWLLMRERATDTCLSKTACSAGTKQWG